MRSDLITDCFRDGEHEVYYYWRTAIFKCGYFSSADTFFFFKVRILFFKCGYYFFKVRILFFKVRILFFKVRILFLSANYYF